MCDYWLWNVQFEKMNQPRVANLFEQDMFLIFLPCTISIRVILDALRLVDTCIRLFFSQELLFPVLKLNHSWVCKANPCWQKLGSNPAHILIHSQSFSRDFSKSLPPDFCQWFIQDFFELALGIRRSFSFNFSYIFFPECLSEFFSGFLLRYAP